MTYTNRLKLGIITDILFIAALFAFCVLEATGTLKSIGAMLAIILMPGVACVAASFYKEESGEYRKWRNVWKDPTLQKAIYIGLAVVIIILIIKSYGPELCINMLIFLLIMMNSLVRDIRYYRNAVKYDMDNLEDVNELVSKYPEARQYINKKQLIVTDENEDEL